MHLQAIDLGHHRWSGEPVYPLIGDPSWRHPGVTCSPSGQRRDHAGRRRRIIHDPNRFQISGQAVQERIRSTVDGR